MKLSLSPDPMPEEVVFAVPGFKSSDPKINPAEIFKYWEATRYHHPGDDMNQPGLQWDEAAKYARFVFLCGYDVAEDRKKPTWNKGDFFGEHYGKH